MMLRPDFLGNMAGVRIIGSDAAVGYYRSIRSRSRLTVPDRPGHVHGRTLTVSEQYGHVGGLTEAAWIQNGPGRYPVAINGTK